MCPKKMFVQNAQLVWTRKYLFRNFAFKIRILDDKSIPDVLGNKANESTKYPTP